MALRASRRHGGVANRTAVSGKKEKRDPRLKRAAAHAAAHVAEALENRRLLAVAPAGLAYHWNHMPEAARHQIAVYEYIDPQFQVRLNAELAEYALQPIAPEAGTLAGMGADGRSRWHRHGGGRHGHKVNGKPHHRHGRDVSGSPTITDSNFYFNSLPDTVEFTFDEPI